MIRALAAVLLVVLLLIGGLVGALLWFPGPLLRAGLRAAGLEVVAFDQVEVGPTALEITGLRIGAPPEHHLGRLQIRYRLPDLLRGRIASIEAEGLELRGRVVDGRIELAGLEPGKGRGGGLGLPAWPDQVVVRTTEVQLGTPWGELRLPLSAELRPGRPEAELSLRVTSGELVNDAGRLSVDLDLQGHLPLDGSVTLGALSAQGRLEVASEHFALPDLAEAIQGRGELTFAVGGGRIDARVGPAEVSVGSLAAPLASLEDVLPTPWQIRLGDRSGPIRITSPLDLDAPALQLEGGLDLAAGAARIGADLSARLNMAQGGELSTAAATAALTLGQIRWRDLGPIGGRLGLQAEGGPDGWQGIADLELAGGGAPTPAVAVAGATLIQKLAFAMADDRLTLSVNEPGRLAVDRLTWPGGGRAGPLAFRLEPGDSPLLVVIFGADGAIGWQEALRAEGETFDLTAGAIKGRARPTDLTVAASGDQARLGSAQVGIAGGRLQLPDQQITFEGIASELALTADGLAPEQAIPVTVASISQGGKPAWFEPLALTGTLRPNPGRLDFEARVSRPASELVLTLRGSHDLARGEGHAELNLAPLTLTPGRLQPAGVTPVLGQRLRDVRGRIALDGTLAWGKSDQIDVDLALLLDNLAFGAGPARFEQVNGVVQLDRLWPLTTPPGQQLAIGLLNFGLPLTEGLMDFRIDSDQTLAVEQLRWSFAGGTVRARPFRVGSATSDIKVILTAEGLDLGQLFALTRLDSLSGEGRIHGSLPIRIKGGVAVIESGELEADGPGWLRYRPGAPPTALEAGGTNVSLLLQALENFHYEALRITLDGRTDAEMGIKLHVRGANPKLYGGYPIEFNLNLEGELANILRSGLATYQIPERIREQMRGFRR